MIQLWVLKFQVLLLNEMMNYNKYRNYPEGSGGKKLYDMYHLPYEKFLIKYYSEVDLTRWEDFYNQFILPLVRETDWVNYQISLRKIKPPFLVQYDRFKEFLDEDFSPVEDVDLTNFLAFLYSIEYFETLGDVIVWTKRNDFLNHSFIQLASKRAGVNYLKSVLRELPILNFH